MEQQIDYESLAAKNKLDEDSSFYLDTFNKALQDKDNKNIAITGGYGAGKTTIIDSYFEENKSEADKMMRVSIATFQPKDGDPNLTEHNLLEQQILQQMFFQVNPNKVPNSKFTKISDLSFLYVFGFLLYLLFTIVFTIMIISNNWLNQFYSTSTGIFDFFLSNWLWLLILSAIIILNGISILVLLIFFRKLGVSRFGIASTTIEFNFKDGSTVFNHYLDEIIYLFKKTEFKYIIFEDLDRFQNVNIFERLRSLNTALNRSAKLTDRNIKFVYALKDDIFTGEDETESIYNRTKFFDFIIPTVKVMHSSNAESILLEKLSKLLPEENGQVDDSNSNSQKLSRTLIEDVALFINDMRTLINICNEFEVFRLRLRKSSVTYDNLFAFIVYKNIYPKDYSDLLENRGLVFDVFNKKEKIVRSLEKEINMLKGKTANGLGSIITDKNDIAMLFSQKKNLNNKELMKDGVRLISISNYHRNYISEGQTMLNYLLREGIDGEFTLCQNGTPIQKYLNVKEFVTINSVNYLDLYRDFEEKRVKIEKEIESQIGELKKKIKYVETKKSISRLLTEDGIDLHIKLTDKKLLYFLIRNNWLNESYEDYLTVFREGSISKADNDFILSVKLGYTKENLHLELKNKGKVTEKVRVDDINSIAVLNIDFIKYLLKNGTASSYEKLIKITQILFKDLKQHLEEVLILIEALKDVNSNENLVWKFLKISMENGIDIWEVVEEASTSKEQKEDYAITLLENCNLKELWLRSSVNLRDFLSNELDVRKLTNSDNLYVALEGLKVKFAFLSDIKEESILENIIQINGYQINLVNLRNILGEDISIKLIKEDKRIYDYCLDAGNLEIFITDVLIQQEIYKEDEETFVKFIKQLADNDINNSVIESIIHHWSGIITDLNSIDLFELITILYNEKKVKLTWDNLEYCSNVFKNNKKRFDIGTLLSTEDLWIEFIENSSEPVQTRFKNEEKYNLFVSPILKLKIADNPKIEEFIAKLKFPVILKDVSEIDNKIFMFLIDYKILSWNDNIYSLIHSEKHKEAFIEENINEARDDIPMLIEGHELIWSISLFEMIIEFEELGEDLIEQYIRDNLLQIEYQEFKLITDNYGLEFDDEIIRILINETNKEDILIVYLIRQWRADSKSDVVDTIHDYHVPWSKELFKEIRKDNAEVAANYLLTHLDKIDVVKMDQELFNTLIAKSDNSKIVIDLINQYQDEVGINKQISEKLYKLLKTEPEIVVGTLNQNTVIKTLGMLSLGSSSEFLYQLFVKKRFNREEIFGFLSKLNEPYSSIKLNGGQIRITTNHTNIEELMEYLKSESLKVISTITPIEEGYLVNNKRK